MLITFLNPFLRKEPKTRAQNDGYLKSACAMAYFLKRKNKGICYVSKKKKPNKQTNDL
jgi:hypothetical protein